MKYRFIRQEFLLRTSIDLMDLIRDMAEALRVTKTDVVNFILADTLDPTHTICPDYDVLPEVLNNSAYNRAQASMARAKRQKEKGEQTLKQLMNGCDDTFDDICDTAF